MTTGKRILISDADPELVARLQRILLDQGRGFDVLTAVDGAAALEIIRRLPIDLVITGLNTPKVDGLQLLAEINRHHRTVKVIVMAGPKTLLPRAVIRMMGASATCEQPVDLRELTGAVFTELQIRHKGEVWGIQLTSFLQMLNADLKTCTVTVTTPSQAGRLYLVEGELIGAECNGQSGDGALYTILNWNDPIIEIDYLPFDQPRTLTAGLMSLLMEAQHRKDTIRTDALQMRKHTRYRCLVAVDFNLADASYRHLIRDLSDGGAFIDSDARAERGEFIELSLYSMRHQQRCALRGRVVRTEPHGFAVQFVDMDEAKLAFLRGETT